jgi:hypothetical protein
MDTNRSIKPTSPISNQAENPTKGVFSPRYRMDLRMVKKMDQKNEAFSEGFFKKKYEGHPSALIFLQIKANLYKGH